MPYKVIVTGFGRLRHAHIFLGSLFSLYSHLTVISTKRYHLCRGEVVKYYSFYDRTVPKMAEKSKRVVSFTGRKLNGKNLKGLYRKSYLNGSLKDVYEVRNQGENKTSVVKT